MGAKSNHTRNLLFLVAACLLVDSKDSGAFAGVRAAESVIPWCSNVCAEETCYATCKVGYGEGDIITCGEYGVYETCCGDGLCENFEEMQTCSADCPPPVESCDERSIFEQDCGGGAICVQGGCCVFPCSGEECGEEERTCEQGASICADDDDCCPDEFCLRVLCNPWAIPSKCPDSPVYIDYGPACTKSPYVLGFEAGSSR